MDKDTHSEMTQSRRKAIPEDPGIARKRLVPASAWEEYDAIVDGRGWHALLRSVKRHEESILEQALSILQSTTTENLFRFAKLMDKRSDNPGKKSPGRLKQLAPIR